MTFLPEDDREELALKAIEYSEIEEPVQNGIVRRAVLFPNFTFEGTLFASDSGALTPRTQCDLLVVIPAGYARTKLDSFYTRPHLKRHDGAYPNCAKDLQTLFNHSWQFWSRHLTDEEWEKSGRDLITYLHIVRDAFRQA